MYPHRMQRAHTDGNGFHINATTHEPYYGVVDGVYYINRFGHEIQPVALSWCERNLNQLAEDIMHKTLCSKITNNMERRHIYYPLSLAKLMLTWY